MKQRGHHFRRQAPIEGFIVDFACYRSRLIVEVDGSQHGSVDHTRRDADRDARLAASRFHVLRIWNNDVDRDIDAAMESIVTALDG